jgi:hypothetical protein
MKIVWHSSRLELLALASTVLVLLMPFTELKWLASPLLICVWPGIASARWLGLKLDWRDVRLWATVIICGLAFSPLIAFITAQFALFNPTLVTLSIGFTTAAALVSAPRLPVGQSPIHISRRALFLMLITLLVVFIALVPIRNEYRSSILPGYGAVMISDWYKHYGITWEIEASGLPPKNLLYLEQPPRTQTYHLFFHTTAALVDLLTEGTVGIGTALVIITLGVTASVLMAVYALARVLWRNETAAVGSLLYPSLLGSLAIVPNLVVLIPHLSDGANPFIHLETWGGCQSLVDTFFSEYTWVPQHAMSLAIVLLAWSVYINRAGKWRGPLFIALLLVSAFGYSVYVPMGVLIGVMLLSAINSARAIRFDTIAASVRSAAPWLCAGIVALIVVAPLAMYQLQAFSARSSGSAVAPVSFWLRSPSIGPASLDLSHGVLFEGLFPLGGIIAQALDLPLFYLFELGATLLLAMIGISVWRGRMRDPAWVIGGLVALSSLVLTTFVKTNVGCNDFGMRGILPFQAVVTLWAGGGWWALLGRPSDMPDTNGTSEGSLQWTTRGIISGFLVILGPMLLSVLVILAAYQAPWVYYYPVLQPDGVPRSTIGLYAIESANGSSWRWTRDHVVMPFDGAAQNLPYQLIVQVDGSQRPPNAPSAITTVLANGRPMGQFMPTENNGMFEFEVPPAPVAAAAGLSIELQVAAYRPSDFGQGDTRKLGLLLNSVTLKPLAPMGPVVLPPVDLLVAAAFLSFFTLQVGRKRVWLIMALAVIAVGLLTIRPWITPLLPYASLLMGGVWFVWRIAPRLAGVVSAQVAGGHSRRLLLVIVTPFVIAGLAMAAWQLLTYDVSKFLPAYDWPTAVFDGHSLVVDDALRFIRSQTPKDIVLQVDPARENYANWVSVAAERPQFFTGDQVFVYEVNEAEREARRQVVQQAFASRNANEACSRFRALGINMLLVERAVYSWTAGLNITPGCLKTLYQNETWSVLSIGPE